MPGQKNDIIAELYRSGTLDGLINRKAPKGLEDDFRAEIYAALLELDEALLVDLHATGRLMFYACRIVMNMASRTGRFQYKYRNHNHSELLYDIDDTEAESINPDRVVELFNRHMDAKFPRSAEDAHDVLIFREYLQLRSCAMVSKLFGIPEYHIKKVVKKVKNELIHIIRNDN